MPVGEYQTSCYIFPVTTTSKPEFKTLDLIVFEESQDLSDRIIKRADLANGSSLTPPGVYIGTAGTQICYFYRLIQFNQALVLDFDKIATRGENYTYGPIIYSFDLYPVSHGSREVWQG